MVDYKVIPPPQSAAIRGNAPANTKVPNSLIISERINATVVRLQAGL
jgi:hypothetical protein